MLPSSHHVLNFGLLEVYKVIQKFMKSWSPYFSCRCTWNTVVVFPLLLLPASHVSVGIDQIRVVGGIVFRSEGFIFDTVDWIVMAGKHCNNKPQ